MGLDSLTQKSHTLIVINEEAAASSNQRWREMPVGRSVFVFFVRTFFWRRKSTLFSISANLPKKTANRGWIRLRLFYQAIAPSLPNIPPVSLGYYYKRVTFYKRVMP